MAKKIKKFNEIDLENEKEVRKFIDDYKISTVNAKVPEIFTANVSDYHEFRDIASSIEEYLGLEYDYEEVGHSGGSYEAVFWLMEKPEDFINAIKKTYEFE